jgi:carboxypeptidase Q
MVNSLISSKWIFFIFFFCQLWLGGNHCLAQDKEKDAFFIKSIYDHALTNQQSYVWLDYLSEKIGGRIAGSPQSMAAVEFTHQVLDTLGADQVWNQPCTVNYWFRGEKEQVKIINNPLIGTKDLRGLALGNSGSTGPLGLSATVVEVKSLEEARQLGTALKDKIVFFSRAFDQRHIRTFHAYGGAVDQRGTGPNLASKFGAKAVLIRSMSTRTDDYPHTGNSWYEEGVKHIPAVALSTKDADLLSQLCKNGPVSVYVRTTCEDRGPKQSYSVIAEIKGSEKPNEIILVGGHLDSWDVGGGAHDDGAGCVQSMEVFYLFKKLGYKPKRTIRCVLFMNEENGLAGGTTYAEISNKNKEYHLAAIESDAGGFTPRGFGFDADTSALKNLTSKVKLWDELLSSYGLQFEKGGGGADIGPLRSQKGLLIGLSPDSQRYFDYHHTEIDHIQAVHPRELALGSAAMASLVYLIDQYGLHE